MDAQGAGAGGRAAAADVELDAAERRVLGSLLEKALATPDYYPLTLKALVAACNQRNNRDPVLALSDDAVRAALSALQARGLVLAVKVSGGHATRWRHEVERRLGLQVREQAILAELLLRGPQTVGELRTRASRMRGLADLEEVEESFAKLNGDGRTFVVTLPAQAGSRAARHADTLRPPAELEALRAGAARAVGVSPPSESPSGASARPGAASPGALPAGDDALARRVADLERRVAELEDIVTSSDGA